MERKARAAYKKRAASAERELKKSQLNSPQGIDNFSLHPFCSRFSVFLPIAIYDSGLMYTIRTLGLYIWTSLLVD